jgi:hypothetical protein
MTPQSNTIHPPSEVSNAVKQLFSKRGQIVDKTLFQMPFAHPSDMKLYYKKYGLSMRGIAPFFDPDKFETYNYEGEIMRLLQKNGD